MFLEGSARRAPGLVRKPSAALATALADAKRRGTIVTPNPGSLVFKRPLAPPASVRGMILTRSPSRRIDALDMRNTLSKTDKRSFFGIGAADAIVMAP